QTSLNAGSLPVALGSIAPSVYEGVVLSEAAISVSDLISRTNNCLLKDQFRLRRRLHNCKSLAEEAKLNQLQRIAADIFRSESLRAARLQALPKVTYPPQLPVSEK